MARRPRLPPAASESELLTNIITSARTLLNSRFAPPAAVLEEWLTEIVRDAERLKQQAVRGIHRNPGLTIFGNPGGRQMSGDVLAVLYRHAEDGEFYCHGFGNADIRLDGDPDNGVSIEGLRTRTGVTMTANSDGSITLRHKSRKLWGDF